MSSDLQGICDIVMVLVRQVFHVRTWQTNVQFNLMSTIVSCHIAIVYIYKVNIDRMSQCKKHWR
jgi:hypothetical protein